MQGGPDSLGVCVALMLGGNQGIGPPALKGNSVAEALPNLLMTLLTAVC